MDPRENRGKQETKEVAEPDNAADIESSSMDYGALLQKMQMSTKNTLDHLDRLIQSSSARSHKKA